MNDPAQSGGEIKNSWNLIHTPPRAVTARVFILGFNFRYSCPCV